MRKSNQLNNLKVQKIKEPGIYGDGNGLYLQVTRSLTKSWLFRYMKDGNARSMGLGSLAIISLAEARQGVVEAKRLLLQGIDPIENRKESKQKAALDVAKTITFDECAKAYIDSHRAGWKHVKQAIQWENSLKNYASPTFGKLSIQLVDTALIMKVLKDVWAEKPETASRVRNRVELIIDWATANEFRTGENPARWKGHLDKLLPLYFAICVPHRTRQYEHARSKPNVR